MHTQIYVYIQQHIQTSSREMECRRILLCARTEQAFVRLLVRLFCLLVVVCVLLCCVVVCAVCLHLCLKTNNCMHDASSFFLRQLQQTRSHIHTTGCVK